MASGPTRRRTTTALRAALFRDATEVLRAEFDRPITLAEVSARVAASPRQVRRAFAEVGETTFRGYVRELRLDRAAALLAETDLPVRDVAARVGYQQPSQFTKAFKRSHGATPSAFRAAGPKRPSSGG